MRSNYSSLTQHSGGRAVRKTRQSEREKKKKKEQERESRPLTVTEDRSREMNGTEEETGAVREGKTAREEDRGPL